MTGTILRLAAAGLDISCHLPSLYMLARRCSSLSVPIVELGVRMGNSTLAMLAACEETCGRLVSYDIDAMCPSNVRLTASANSGDQWPTWKRVLQERWEFRCKDSIEAAADWPKGEACVGMLFLDAMHEYESTRDELAAWLPKLRRDAVICGHDYLLESGGVKRAVDEFAAAHADRFDLIVLPHDWGLFVLLPRLGRPASEER